MPTQVRILPPPSPPSHRQSSGFTIEAKVWGKRRVTLPAQIAEVAEVAVGDRLRVSADGYGRILLERIELPAAGDQPELPAA